MPSPSPTLHLFCGKIASGKSTLAQELCAKHGALLISEDAWLAAFYSDQMSTGQDFFRCSARLRTAMAPHITGLLKAGISVVLDFQANTLESRAWMREVIDTSGAAHELHFLDASDDLCLARLQSRNTGGTHPFQVTEAQFRQFSKYFAPPTAREGFKIVRHVQTQ